MASHEHAIECTITLIERFLSPDLNDDYPPNDELLRGISHSLEVAQAARVQAAASEVGALSTELCIRYKHSLERLRERLASLGNTLREESGRLIQEESHLQRAREWRASLGRTQ